MTQKPAKLNTLLKNSHPQVKHYVTALERENAVLQRDIAKLQANQVSLKNRIKAQEKQLKQHGILDLGEALRRVAERARQRAPQES